MTKLSPMRRAVGLVMLMIGVVWFLIGVGMISGSQFSGSTPTAVVGAAVAIGGVFVLTWKVPAPGKRDRQPPDAGNGP